jgi:hypothetical protein
MKIPLLHANDLKNTNLQKRAINEYVENIILQINKELQSAKLYGKHFIITEIPIIFDIPHMTQSDSQRIIWAKIISLLKEKSFDVKINPTNDSCRLKITWFSDAEQRDMDHQNKIIKDNYESF